MYYSINAQGDLPGDKVVGVHEEMPKLISHFNGSTEILMGSIKNYIFLSNTNYNLV